MQRCVIGDAALRNHLLVGQTIRSKHDGIEQARVGEHGHFLGDVRGPDGRSICICARSKTPRRCASAPCRQARRPRNIAS